MDTGKLAPIVQLPRDVDFMTDEAFAKLRALACTPGAIERLLECASRMPTLESRCVQLESRCNQLQSACAAWDSFLEAYVCPGNVNYSQRTLDEYSDNAQVDLDQIVTGLGGDYVNAFPVPPGKIIRLQHKARPGFTPQKIAIDLNIAGGGQNYLDFLIQFFLVPGGTGSDLGLELGSQMRGNQFLNKDGTQIHLKFPEYRAQPIDVGSLETLAINIKNTGAANNLDSAFVTVYYDPTKRNWAAESGMTDVKWSKVQFVSHDDHIALEATPAVAGQIMVCDIEVALVHPGNRLAGRYQGSA